MEKEKIADKRTLSHEVNPANLAASISKIKDKIKHDGDKPYVTVERQLQIVDELAEFGFGQFLLQNQGINGYWTHYMLTHPWKGRKTGMNSDGQPFSKLEKILLDDMPVIRATQQRFEYFLAENQKAVRNGAKLACVPCGMMGELLYLNYAGVTAIDLIGIDIDPQTLSDAQELAQSKNLLPWSKLIVKDAWDLKAYNEFTLISSNGLTIYEPSDEKVTSLYKNFYNALTTDGKLVTSFLTFLPSNMEKCEWDMGKINQEAALLQKIIFIDILSGKYQCYRTTEQTKQQLQSVGFKNIQFIYDDARIFPTVVAYK